MDGSRTQPKVGIPARIAALLLAGFASAGPIACTGTRAVPDPAPPPTAKHLEFAEKAGYPATTLRALAYGRRLYIERCAGCHTLYPFSAFKAREWPGIVKDMRINGGIGEDQIRDITRYLVAMAASLEEAAGTRPPSR